jgi:hypothetical protein
MPKGLLGWLGNVGSLKPGREPVTHDLTRRYWGHDISSMGTDKNGDTLVCVFFPATITKGDLLVVAGSSSTGKYVVTTDVRRPMDPGDQHFMSVRRIS